MPGSRAWSRSARRCELGLDAEALAPDIEPGGLVLPPERTRGEVIGGSVQEAAEQLVGMLRAKRLVG